MTAPHSAIRSAPSARSRSGMTLVELMVVVGVMVVIIGITVPTYSDWRENQRAKDTARSIADLLMVARSEAIRTGNRYVLFFGTLDPSNNAVEVGGKSVPVLLINDGAPSAADCEIDAGEAFQAIEPVDGGFPWGVTYASAAVPTDSGGAPFSDGATFTDPANTPVKWLLFRPDGVPVTFTGVVGGCGTIGGAGSGGGAFYITNGVRDFAVVLSPLGGVRVHVGKRAGGWTG